jgi:CBS domain-containing protein
MNKRLVRDWMSPNPLSVNPQSTLLAAYTLMTGHHIRRLPVTDDGRLVGILTLGDIREFKPSEAMTLSVFDTPNALAHLSVAQAMTPRVVTTTPDSAIHEAARMMLANKIGGLPVMDAGRLVGVITESDIFGALLNEFQSSRAPAGLVQQWMTPQPLTVGPKTKAPAVRQLMNERHIRHLPVVEDGRLMGIVSLGDLRGAEPSPFTTLGTFEQTYLRTLMNVGQIMKYDPYTISPTATIYEAAALMVAHKIGGIPVMEHDRLVGIISESDVLRMASQTLNMETA